MKTFTINSARKFNTYFITCYFIIAVMYCVLCAYNQYELNKPYPTKECKEDHIHNILCEDY